MVTVLCPRCGVKMNLLATYCDNCARDLGVAEYSWGRKRLLNLLYCLLLVGLNIAILVYWYRRSYM